MYQELDTACTHCLPATAGDADYVPRLKGSASVTFERGTDTQVCTIEILNDELSEADETFTVLLTNPVPPTMLGEPTTAVVTILDDEGEGESYS